MDRDEIKDEDLYRFILLQIDTVPHLEALLLIWRNRPRSFSEAELATQLFVNTATARGIADDLSRAKLLRHEGARYSFEPGQPHQLALMDALSDLYRRDLINISKLIHSKASSAALDFARAFKFTKD